MPRTTGQNERIRQATRAAIISAAMVLFARHGFSRTTTREIAEKAGISTGLMYHYFDSKESLLQAVFEHCMHILGRSFEQAYQRSEPHGRVGAVLRQMFQILREDREFWRLFYMLRSQPAIMELLGEDFRLWTRRLRDLFASEYRQGGRTEPELDAQVLYSLIEGTIQQYLLDPDHYPLQAVSGWIIERYGSARQDPMTRRKS